MEDGIINYPSVILRVDLNFTKSTREVWGENVRLDLLGPGLNEYFQEVGLVDVKLVDLIPTWHNGKVGNRGIAKILDPFYISEDLVSFMQKFRSWVVPTIFSEHMPT